MKKEKIKKNALIILLALILLSVVLASFFYIIIIATGMWNQYNERQAESDSSWLYLIDGRGCNDFANVSDEKFEKYARRQLGNISAKENKRIKSIIIEIQRKSEKYYATTDLKDISKKEKNKVEKITMIVQKPENKKFSENCSFARQRLLKILESM